MGNKLLEFQHDEVAEVANRISMQLHRSVDMHFPDVTNESKRFSKTVFAPEDTAATKKGVVEKRLDQSSSPTPQPVELGLPNSAISDLSQLPPLTQNEVGEFSNETTMQKTRVNRPSAMRKIMVFFVTFALLSLGAAYFVHKFLIE